MLLNIVHCFLIAVFSLTIGVRGCTLYKNERFDVLQRIPRSATNSTSKMDDLRSLMREFNISAYIIRIDEEGRLAWISGFTGSNGEAVVTLEKAALWTDGRYFIQAEDELDENWELMKSGEPGVLDLESWIISPEGAELVSGSRVGVDPFLTNAETFLELEKKLEEFGLSLASVRDNLIDKLWTVETGRPQFIPKLVVPHPLEYSGRSVGEKLLDLRDNVTDLKATSMIVNEQDEVAWLFNLRGEGDSLYEGLMLSPIFQSLALVTQKEVILWLHVNSTSEGVFDHLNPIDCQSNLTCVEIRDYHSVMTDLREWGESLDDNSTEKILLSKKSIYLSGASYAIYESLPKSRVQISNSPILSMKAVKNEVEIRAMIESQIRDSMAVCEFFAHLQEVIPLGTPYSELSAADLLKSYRSEQPYYKGESFTTISAYGANAASAHYSPTNETDTPISTDNLYLVDSGAQYENGCTTDVTRTVHFGNPTGEQIEMYTLVLMGAIDLARVSLPENTLDVNIDLVTRQHLFERNLNYRHGTGHGIGAYLKVHEGPINIGMSGSRSTGHLKAGMFFSDEPGYYKENEFGIRLETILRVVLKDETEAGYGAFIHFEPVTFVPFEPSLIDFSLMSPKQIEWLNQYNSMVREKVASLLKAEDKIRAYEWVMSRTERVSPSLSNDVIKWKDEI